MKRSLLAPAVRERLKRLPPPYDSHYGVVPAPPPETALDLRSVSRRHEDALAALARIDAIAAEAPDPYLVSRVLTRREAVSSSAIEGTNSTLDELLAAEETADETTKSAARQARDYALVLDHFLGEARRKGPAIFSCELIRDLHARIMSADPDYKDAPGALREIVVWIGGGAHIAYSTWTPPPPEEVRACLIENVDYMRNEGLQQVNHNLIVRMAVAHAHFEAVHPFRDGNGRVGRILLPLIMAADGRVPLYLSPYIDANRADYYAALKAAQQRLEWPKLILFLSDAIVATVEELLTTRRALQALRKKWLRRRRFRKDSAALRLLDLLPHFPVITTPRAAEILGVSAPQVNRAVAQLAAAGILVERTGHARNRIFAAREALAIINRPFGEAPIDLDAGEVD
jgi:Fic family protein